VRLLAPFTVVTIQCQALLSLVVFFANVAESFLAVDINGKPRLSVYRGFAGSGITPCITALYRGGVVLMSFARRLVVAP